MDYPIWDLAIGGPMLMASVAIAHVIVAHFAIGGGLVIAVTETLAVKRDDFELRELARRSSLMLILVSTVFGALSGVGIWLVAGLIAPATISSLIHNFVWGWAIEWVFFIVEIAAALIYFTTWGKISKGAHVFVGWLYFGAAYGSLVVINGIITFMLTPGEWLQTGAFWDGFFNPTYWPALLLRTGIVMMMATAFMLFPALKASREARPRLVRYLGLWLVAGSLVGYAGYRWWEGALPESVRTLFVGETPALAALGDTRQFLLWAVTAALALAVLFLVGLPKTVRLPFALLVMASGFAFFGGYERLREGVRKPYLIHDYQFSNGLLVEDVAELREAGVLSRAGWAAAAATDDEVVKGRQVFRAQCSACHTIDGYQAIRPLLADPDMTYGILYTLDDQGEAWTELEPGQRVDKASLDYPFMPPFVGTEEELEALNAYLAVLGEGPATVAAGGGTR